MAGALRLLSRLIEHLAYARYRIRMRRLLRAGLQIGENVTIEDTAYLDHNYPFLVSIGNNCSICAYVRILAHDATMFKYNGGHTRIGRVRIEDNCFIGEYSIILPGVTIGPNVLVAAGSLVGRSIPGNSCVAGVPARVYRKFDDLLEEYRQGIETGTVFHCTDVHGRIRRSKGWEQRVDEIRAATKDGLAYVRGYQGKYAFTWAPRDPKPF